MGEYFLWYKALHIISVISWMAAMLYLPRLFVYHCDAKKGDIMDETFKIMERRLLKVIMTPAMIFTYIFGFLLTYEYGLSGLGGWFHVKLTTVLALSAMHGIFAKWVKDFARGENKHGAKFYRFMNEVPTILMIITVLMVVIKPF